MANLTFSYTSQVPQGTQQINQTQVPIENNFEDIAQLFAVNHSPFNTATVPDATPGLHNMVTYFAQSGDPTPVANAINMYSKAVAGDANGYELFYQYASGSVGQLTGVNNGGTSTKTGGAVASGSYGTATYQYLEGGILIKTGYFLINNGINSAGGVGANPQTFSFPVIAGFPAFSKPPFNIQASVFLSSTGNTVNGGVLYVSNFTATSFQIFPTTTGYVAPNACYFAIGV
jgi:hypothetical protein